jgi:hypothetical protein
MRAPLAAAALVSAALALSPRTARAWERSQGFGADVGMAMLTVNSESPELGIAYGLHYSLALTDQFDFVGELGGATVDLHPIVTSTSPTDRPAQMWNVDAGVIYKLDIVQFVPYFGALAGGYLMTGGSLPSSRVLPGGEVAVGGDYLLSRRWAVGLSIREHFLFTDLGTYPSYLTVTGRVELNWGGM